jgi:hypothetical protein
VIFATGFLLLRAGGLRVVFPVERRPVDYGLIPPLPGAGVVLYFARLLPVLPVALPGAEPRRTSEGRGRDGGRGLATPKNPFIDRSARK